jgi:hypothetical protein
MEQTDLQGVSMVAAAVALQQHGSVALEAAWCHCAANCGRSYTTSNYNEYQMGGGK